MLHYGVSGQRRDLRLGIPEPPARADPASERLLVPGTEADAPPRQNRIATLLEGRLVLKGLHQAAPILSGHTNRQHVPCGDPQTRTGMPKGRAAARTTRGNAGRDQFLLRTPGISRPTGF